MLDIGDNRPVVTFDLHSRHAEYSMKISLTCTKDTVLSHSCRAWFKMPPVTCVYSKVVYRQGTSFLTIDVCIRRVRNFFVPPQKLLTYLNIHSTRTDDRERKYSEKKFITAMAMTFEKLSLSAHQDQGSPA